MKTKEFGFKSATGVCDIYGCQYAPDDGEAKAVIVMHHGMAEHQQRYRGFFEYLTGKGYAVFMHDMANHGKSNQDFAIAGHFGNEGGNVNLIKDFKSVFDIARAEYPDKKIIIAGHSMGSFIARDFVAMYRDESFNGAIFIGSGGPNPLAGVGAGITKMMAKTMGATHKSKLIDKMVFGAYNNKFEKRTNFDWLTKDNAIVDAYIADKYCGFLFTVSGMNDLIKIQTMANSDKWYSDVKTELPILITSGAMDPVGDYGKGLETVCSRLKETGHNATLKLYDNDRHEILNELDKETVYADLNNWITENVL